MMNWIKILPFFTLYNQQNITNYIYLNENKPVSQLCPVCTSKQFPWTHCELPQPLISVMRFYVLCFHLSQTFWKYPYLYKRGPKTTVDLQFLSLKIFCKTKIKPTRWLTDIHVHRNKNCGDADFIFP